MEIRIYKDGAKTGKVKKLVVAGVLVAGVAFASGYAVMKLNMPFLQVEIPTMIAIMAIGFFTFAEVRGLPFWQFVWLAIKFKMTITQRYYKKERRVEVEETTRSEEKTKVQLFRQKLKEKLGQ